MCQNHDCKCYSLEHPKKDDLIMNVNQNLNAWLKFGDRGISSEAIVSKITGLNLTGRHGLQHPYDVADFRRCCELLQAVPELKNRLFEMESASPQWKRFVENWDEFEGLLESGKWCILSDKIKDIRSGKS